MPRWDTLSGCQLRGQRRLIVWSDLFWWNLWRAPSHTCLWLPFSRLPCSLIESFHWWLWQKPSPVGKGIERGREGVQEIERGSLKITPKLKPLLPNPRVGRCLHEFWILFLPCTEGAPGEGMSKWNTQTSQTWLGLSAYHQGDHHQHWLFILFALASSCPCILKKKNPKKQHVYTITKDGVGARGESAVHERVKLQVALAESGPSVGWRSQECETGSRSLSVSSEEETCRGEWGDTEEVKLDERGATELS